MLVDPHAKQTALLCHYTQSTINVHRNLILQFLIFFLTNQLAIVIM